jgi:hypothetical protein
MELEIIIYNTTMGDGAAYYKENISASSFDELEKNILSVYNRAQGQGVIKISDKYKGEWVPVDDEEVMLETSLVILNGDQEINLGSCRAMEDHIISWTPPGEYEYESSFGKFDKDPYMCEVSDYFDFYLGKIKKLK